jgi:hypothetical protein
MRGAPADGGMGGGPFVQPLALQGQGQWQQDESASASRGSGSARSHPHSQHHPYQQSQQPQHAPQQPSLGQGGMGPNPSAGGAMQGPTGSSRRIHVRNLPWEVTSTDLHTIFEQYGPVDEAMVIMHKSDPNKSRGFGFVNFQNPESVQAVFANPPPTISNREIHVALAAAHDNAAGYGAQGAGGGMGPAGNMQQMGPMGGIAMGPMGPIAVGAGMGVRAGYPLQQHQQPQQQQTQHQPQMQMQQFHQAHMYPQQQQQRAQPASAGPQMHMYPQFVQQPMGPISFQMPPGVIAAPPMAIGPGMDGMIGSMSDPMVAALAQKATMGMTLPISLPLHMGQQQGQKHGQ